MNQPFVKIYRFFIILVLIAFGLLMHRTGVIKYLSDPYELAYTLVLVKQHIVLMAISMTMATVLGLGIGIMFTRPALRGYAGFAMYWLSLGQTIPSLAVIALAMSILGIGYQAAVFALFVYSVLPIARNTMAGIKTVPPWMIDAARGMGMTNMRILFQVELPNAMNVILAGFRVALVINIGTAALAFLIGAGGLGEHIFVGIDLMRPDKLLAGAIPTIILALCADYVSGLFGRLIIPKGLRYQDEELGG